MVIFNVLGRPVYLNSRQEATLAHVDKLCKRWEEERKEEQRQKEERDLQYALSRMEERNRRYPMVEKMRRETQKEMEKRNASKHHAWEYDEFPFFHEGVEYFYSKGEISEVFDWDALTPDWRSDDVMVL